MMTGPTPVPVDDSTLRMYVKALEQKYADVQARLDYLTAHMQASITSKNIVAGRNVYFEYPGGVTKINATGGVRKSSFTVSLAGGVATVQAGVVRIHGIGNFPVAAGTVNLTGTYDWVVIEHTTDHSSTRIYHFPVATASIQPPSDAGTFRFPLALCVADGANYRIDHICCDSDIQLAVALA